MCVCVGVLPECIKCTTCVQCLGRSEEDVISTGTGNTDSCDLLCGHWEPNPGPLEEYQLLLVT